MLDNHTTAGVDMNDDRGPWICVASGKKFYPLDPRPEEIDLEDIIGALSKLCRFNGHCDEFYSVAQHSVLMSHLAEERGYSEQIQIICLLHDATEAYVGDMVRPLKSVMADYRAVEDQAWVAIAKHFDLPFELPKVVKELDDLMVVTEKVWLLPNAPEWPNLPEPLDRSIDPLDPLEAAIQFRNRAIQLGLM